GKEALALAEDVAVDAIGRGDFGSSEAAGPVLTGGAAGKVLGCFEAATERVGNQSVLESVFGVAFFVYAIGEQSEFRGREGIGSHALHPVRAGDHVAGVIERGRAGDDAIEVLGEALGNGEGLAASLRTTVVVRPGWIGAVVGMDQEPGGDSGNVQGAKSEIEK